MPRRRIPLFALSLAALPMGAVAQDTDITGARILACEADRSEENCSTLLSQIFVCDNAPEMAGCAELLSLRDAAIDMEEREAEMNDNGADEDTGEDDTGDEDIGIVDEPEDSELDVEVRAEGELVDELVDEALTEEEERLREEDDEDESDDATGRPDDHGADTNGEGENGTNGADENGTNGEGNNGTNSEGDAADAAVPGNGAGEMVCPVLDSADWAAWVNAMPGPDGPSLIVTGVVTLPTPGYSVTLEAGASDRSTRPVQVVQLTAERPAMDAAQVLSQYDVRFEMPSSAPLDGTTAPFTAVRVVCGEEEIARIEPVEVAQ